MVCQWLGMEKQVALYHNTQIYSSVSLKAECKITWLTWYPVRVLLWNKVWCGKIENSSRQSTKCTTDGSKNWLVHVLGGRHLVLTVLLVQHSAIVAFNIKFKDLCRFLGVRLWEEYYHAGHIVTAGSIVICVESQAGITELGRNGVMKDVSEGVLVKAGNHAIAS